MLPAVFFGSDHEAVVRGPLNDAASGVLGHGGIGALRGRAAVPNFAGGATSDVGNTNGPRVWLIRPKKIARGRVAGLGGPSHEGDTLAVERPDRRSEGHTSELQSRLH